MKLFVRSDLERCARLALTYAAPPGADTELAIQRAVRDICEQTEPVFRHEDVVKAAERAVILARTNLALEPAEAALRAVSALGGAA